MLGLWQMWESCIPGEVCDAIVEEGKKLQSIDGAVTTQLLVDSKVRSSKIAWIHHENEDFKEVWSFVERKFHEANSNAFGVDVGFLRNLQFTNYTADTEGKYDWHVDVFWEKNEMYNRKLSMVIQLTDPDTYTGGNLELDCHIPPDVNSLRKKGTLIVFPSFVSHRVTKVESGERNSLVAWMEGPLWR
jgi:PKHD-type hydroxylase